MTVKSFVLICFAFVLGAAASAQSSSVRVTYNTNLRASFSLDARIVDTALAGTTLSVTGSFDRWLKISRNSLEVWMANWVGFTRVDAQPDSSDIDNCCFVDRQCNSNHEWTNGYWAYQNNQCRAPIAPVSSISTPITATDTAEVDNCCFIGWQCHSDSDWERGYHAYQSNSCDHSEVNFRGIMVQGTAGFKALVARGFDLLKNRAPHWYDYAITGLNVVVEVNPPHGSSGVHVDSAIASFNLASPFIPIPDDDLTMAEFLVHEACHVHRHRAGLESGGYSGEKACIEAEVALWQLAAPNTEHHNRKLRYLAVIDRRECQHWLPPVPGGCPYK